MLRHTTFITHYHYSINYKASYVAIPILACQFIHTFSELLRMAKLNVNIMHKVNALSIRINIMGYINIYSYMYT